MFCHWTWSLNVLHKHLFSGTINISGLFHLIHKHLVSSVICCFCSKGTTLVSWSLGCYRKLYHVVAEPFHKDFLHFKVYLMRRTHLRSPGKLSIGTLVLWKIHLAKPWANHSSSKQQPSMLRLDNFVDSDQKPLKQHNCWWRVYAGYRWLASFSRSWWMTLSYFSTNRGKWDQMGKSWYPRSLQKWMDMDLWLLLLLPLVRVFFFNCCYPLFIWIHMCVTASFCSDVLASGCCQLEHTDYFSSSSDVVSESEHCEVFFTSMVFPVCFFLSLLKCEHSEASPLRSL